MKNLLIILIVLVATGCCSKDNSQINCDINFASKEIINEISDDELVQYYDTLIDVNDDGVKELIIEHYGLAGSGLKYRMDIYHFNDSTCKFILNNELNNLANITFDNNFIYGFYIGNGGGEARKYKWIGNQVKLIEKYIINIMNEEADSIWVEHTDYVIGMIDSIFWPDIYLPNEYHYKDYKPILME